jgi:hypothetical protein
MDSGPVVIRLPRTSYLVVVFLFFACFTVGFGVNGSHGLRDSAGHGGFDGFDVGPQTLVFLVPVLAAAFIARTATIVSAEGLRVRALFGSRMLPWAGIRGLTISGRSVYAVVDGGAIRLPCVRIAHLGPISRLSAGRLPELPDATPKPAPQRVRRR